MLQRALLAGLVFQGGDDAGTPGVDHAPAAAGHQAEEVVFALVPEAGDDAPDLEGVEQADAFQGLAKAGQQFAAQLDQGSAVIRLPSQGGDARAVFIPPLLEGLT
ncbi:hypothetical protein D9M68_422690 [compost metagenome]